MTTNHRSVKELQLGSVETLNKVWGMINEKMLLAEQALGKTTEPHLASELRELSDALGSLRESVGIYAVIIAKKAASPLIKV